MEEDCCGHFASEFEPEGEIERVREERREEGEPGEEPEDDGVLANSSYRNARNHVHARTHDENDNHDHGADDDSHQSVRRSTRVTADKVREYYDESQMLEVAEMYWVSHPRFMGSDTVSPKGFPRCMPHVFYQKEGVRIMFLLTFANVTVIETPEGLCLIDTGHATFARVIKKKVREFSSKPVHTAIYTHGHVDHVLGILRFEEVDKIRVIGHKNVAKRFDRYKMTIGYNTFINNKQFNSSNEWTRVYRYPDIEYEDSFITEVGSVKMELYHARGETDDATWVWIPEARILCAGDFFIWASPNCGNPQKVQRYPLEWAAALRKMADCKPAFLFPGHGPPIIGEDRVLQALEDTAGFLESISKQALDGINQGLRLAEIVAKVKIDPYYLSRPYLQPVYDDPGFIVHNLWRHYAGWWDQNPAHLRIGNEAEVALEICRMTGGSEALAEKAYNLAVQGKYDAATNFIEWCYLVDPTNRHIHQKRAFIYSKRVEKETSLMAKGIYSAEQLKSETFLKSGFHYAKAIETYLIQLSEKYDVTYESSALRRTALDWKESLEHRASGILNALYILPILIFILRIFAALPTIRISFQFPSGNSKRDDSDSTERKRHSE